MATKKAPNTPQVSWGSKIFRLACWSGGVVALLAIAWGLLFPGKLSFGSSNRSAPPEYSAPRVHTAAAKEGCGEVKYLVMKAGEELKFNPNVCRFRYNLYKGQVAFLTPSKEIAFSVIHQGESNLVRHPNARIMYIRALHDAEVRITPLGQY